MLLWSLLVSVGGGALVLFGGTWVRNRIEADMRRLDEDWL